MNRIKIIIFATAAMLFVRFVMGWLIGIIIEQGGADALMGLYVVNIMAGIIGGFVVLMLTQLNKGKLLFANLASVGLLYFIFFGIAILIGIHNSYIEGSIQALGHSFLKADSVIISLVVGSVIPLVFMLFKGVGEGIKDKFLNKPLK